PVDTRDLQYAGDDLAEMVVVAGHDPAEQVGRSGGHVGLHHLGNVGQVAFDRGGPALGDLEGDEGRHAVADLAQIQVRAETGDHAGRQQPVETGLSRVAGDA